MPTAGFIDDPPGPSPVAVADSSDEPDAMGAATTDGSLAIGGLREGGS